MNFFSTEPSVFRWRVPLAGYGWASVPGPSGDFSFWRVSPPRVLEWLEPSAAKAAQAEFPLKMGAWIAAGRQPEFSLSHELSDDELEARRATRRETEPPRVALV